MTAMHSIRLLETQGPSSSSAPKPNSRPGTGSPPSTSNSREPWNDIQFSVDGVAAASPGSIVNLSSAGPSDTAAIAPWMTDDASFEPPSMPAAAPSGSRRFFSPKASLSKASGGSGNGVRNRNNSEASSYYPPGPSMAPSFRIGTDFGEAWGVSSAGPSRVGSVDPVNLSPDGSTHGSGKKSLRDRGKDFGRMLKKKASKVGLGKQEGSDDGHLVLPIPPLPYPSSSSLNLSSYGFPSSSASLPKPPSSPIKEKKRKVGNLIKGKSKDKDKDKDAAYGTGSNDFPGIAGDPEIMLDTNLDNMNGIIRPLHEIGAMWDLEQHAPGGGSSSYGQSDHGPLAGAFTDPWAATGFHPDKRPALNGGHSRSHSGAGTLSSSGSKRKSNPPAPLVLAGPSPKGTRAVGAHPWLPPMPPPRETGGKEQWHAPESWDVDKVGPEATDYSSGEEGGDASAVGGPSSAVDAEDFGIIDRGGGGSISPITNIGVSSPQGGPKSKPRGTPTNPFVSIGMIGGVGGGAYGIAGPGYGRLKNHGKPDSRGGEPPSAFGVGSLTGSLTGISGLRKDSWPDNDEIMSRRPSDALSSSTTPKTPSPSFHLRVYRLDGTYHIVECPLTTTAQDLSHVLRKKLLLPGHHYKLHLREKGRERVLGTHERPITILRRRLEQAGYDESDDLENLGGDDLGFLLRFVFRDSNVPAANPTSTTEDEFGASSSSSATPEHIDLSGKGLLTIPIALHRVAPTIVVLNLSKNPHIDIPLDFISACTSLRDLRLSHAAMKQVPSRVKAISTLRELDISCNRMVSLDEANLQEIKGLTNIRVQNNRLATLPAHFEELHNLKFLNISNNKFDTIPLVLSLITSLVELDISFNTISIFPPELGGLVNLKQLIMVGNRVSYIPPEISGMRSLEELDCRRNAIVDVSAVFRCSSLKVLRAENNSINELNLPAGSKVQELQVSGNERLSSFTVDTSAERPYLLERLDLSKCMLSALDDSTFAQLRSLVEFKFDHNTIRSIPDAICQLPEVVKLSGSNNHLASLPEAIGQMAKLQSLHVHNNNIKVIPASIWQCSSLTELSASSNLIANWMDPVVEGQAEEKERRLGRPTGSSHGRGVLPPLAMSLKKLYLADNRLDDDVFHALSHLRSLQILNLSFNDIYELPPLRLPTFALVRELYLSGNKLTSLPGEDLHRLLQLRVLFLNANKLQTLPSELTKVKTLEILDVGNNVLKYNVANWQFDWNWNFNRELRYLNLSGNKRLEIKNTASHDTTRAGRAPLTDFSELTHLRLLGLMDVTLSVNPSIPDDSEERRVRMSPSDINGMAYGIADTLGIVDSNDKSNILRLSMFDLVVPSFRGRDNECLFGMFGRHLPMGGARTNNNRLSKYLQSTFTRAFNVALRDLKVDETVSDALRRAFLGLNKGYFEYINESGQSRKMSSTANSSTAASRHGFVNPSMDGKSAASGLVLYIVDDAKQKMMYVANVGSILAVVSKKQANPLQVSTNHDPFDRNETARIRAAEGWVSPKGTVNDELEISRSFGVFHLLPAVNARPDIAAVPLTDQDEFVIIGNRGLWDYVSPKTAVDIARQNKNDPMTAAQRLRDYAMSYGAQGNTMIMIISIGDLFHPRTRQPAADILDMDLKRMTPRRVEPIVNDRQLARLGKEIPPPTGFLALVFTDIRNSTSLWEKNPGMPTAMKLHNWLLRRQLREIGGYEVKTEGDSFMVSFQSVHAALLWCFNVQVQLLQEEWPVWILDSEDGKEIIDNDGQVLARGLSVRMGIHCGSPNCEPDPVTGRMDYFGTMVNRSARIMASAKGGQIAVSHDVVKELQAVLPLEETKQGLLQSVDNVELAPDVGLAVESIQRMGLIIKMTGEHRLKGLEIPEMLAHVYPRELAGRMKLESDEISEPAAAAPRAQFSVEQVRTLAGLAVRLEALASERVFRPSAMLYRSYSIQSLNGTTGTPEALDHPIFMNGNIELLMPTIRDNATDADLLQIMDSVSIRIENALASLYVKQVGGYNTVLAALEQATQIDQTMLMQALGMFSNIMDSFS